MVHWTSNFAIKDMRIKIGEYYIIDGARFLALRPVTTEAKAWVLVRYGQDSSGCMKIIRIERTTEEIEESMAYAAVEQGRREIIGLIAR